jgi:glycosyltransferase involved in cell wall biosynthesis
MSRSMTRYIYAVALAIDRATGRRLRNWAPSSVRQRALSYRTILIPAPDYSASTHAATRSYIPPAGLLPRFDPLNVEVSPTLVSRPHLNVLLPSLAMKSMSGGANTALSIVARLAAMGIPVRLVSTDLPPDASNKSLLTHVASLAEGNRDGFDFEIVDASKHDRPLTFGANDVFMATAWWTAQMAKYAVRHTKHRKFIYLIQDYEALLHPASSTQALAEETYALDHIPVINTRLLYDFLRTRDIGRYSSDEFTKGALVFEPAVDTNRFFPETKVAARGKRRLLFYARPTGGWRNLFELGVAALQKLIADDSIQSDEWEFCGMGEKFAPLDLGKDSLLMPLPWLDLDGYAQQMRKADVLLSLMLSPHPSYPPLEMAACGRPVVTTTFANKTAEQLAAISPNIIGVPATIEGIADGVLEAMQRAASDTPVRHGGLGLPKTWTESLSAVVPHLYDQLLDLFGAPALPSTAASVPKQSPSRLFPGYWSWPKGYYELRRLAILTERRDLYTKCDSSLFSFITTVWNTAPEYVAQLAESVFGQDGGANFEWAILDNGTSREDTRALLQELAQHPMVRLYRVDENIGIVKGLRYCLERANNKYIVPLDSDDLLTPDCLRILASSLSEADYPAIAYTDEDKVSGQRFQDPYCKPDWDPVLFVHSCYIAHLCAIDRKLAVELGAYTNLQAEGSHDWDTFLRFWQARHRPHHVAEVVYSWRMHPQSTSGNIKSKSYIHASHQSVLNRFILGSPKPQDYKVELSPLFGGAPDWRFVPISGEAPPIPTILYGANAAHSADATPAGRKIIRIEPQLEALLATTKACAADSRLVHIQSTSVTIDDPTWAAESAALMDLFGDTAIVGGRIHDGSKIVRADCYFGFGEGCDSPNIGRSLQDPGYFAQMWKPHSANAVPIEHCVIRADFLIDALTALVETGVGFTYLGAWLGALAKARGLRVVYSPFLAARTKQGLTEDSSIEKAAFCIAWARCIPDAELMSQRLGLTADTAYLPISRDARAAQERHIALLGISDDQTAEALASRVISKSKAKARENNPRPMPSRAEDASLSLITTVWNTDPRYISALANSISGQDREASFEWVILDNGSVRPDTIDYLAQLKQQSFVRLFCVEQNIGIVGGLRYCLERAKNDYVVPIDSDDVLTPDAFRRLTDALNAPARPAYVFSNEDILENTRLMSPIKRSEFDPVLNACDSYIWHLCAFQRTKALQLNAYSDAGAEYCHDWDTVTRFADAGETIHHVPHVLYHWRTHAQSSSNSGSLNSGSMKSTKWLMERTIARQKDPTLYKVQLFPISRGVDQYAVMRKPVKPMRLCLLYLAGTPDIPDTIASKLSATVSEKHVVDFLSLSNPDAQKKALRRLFESDSEAVVLLTQGHEPIDEAGIWDAMLLLELHKDVAAVAGRITDRYGKILSSCTSPAAALTETPSWVGLTRTDPGAFALALKRQTASTIPADYFICRKDILREAICGKSIDLEPASLAERVASVARAHGMRLAYSPLIEATKVE